MFLLRPKLAVTTKQARQAPTACVIITHHLCSKFARLGVIV